MDFPRIDISDTFGAAFIGAMVTAMLYGLTTLQTYLYFVYYPKDSRRNKALVSTVWILDTLHVSLICLCIYHYLVANYANPAALGIVHWSLFGSLLINIILAVLVQSFFTLQIHRLCNPKMRWWMTIIIAVMVAAHFCFGIETVVFLGVHPDFASFQQPHVTLVAATPFAITAVLSDVLIAITLCVLLHESRTGIRSTNMLVSTLIIYAINRCLLTSVVAVIEVIVFSLSRGTLWFLAVDFAIGKLYANSLLASLNSRHSLRENSQLNAGTMITSRLSNFAAASGANKIESDVRGHVINLQVRGKASSLSDGLDSGTRRTDQNTVYEAGKSSVDV